MTAVDSKYTFSLDNTMEFYVRPWKSRMNFSTESDEGISVDGGDGGSCWSRAWYQVALSAATRALRVTRIIDNKTLLRDLSEMDTTKGSQRLTIQGIKHVVKCSAGKLFALQGHIYYAFSSEQSSF